jgi:hypothetical protein
MVILSIIAEGVCQDAERNQLLAIVLVVSLIELQAEWKLVELINPIMLIMKARNVQFLIVVVVLCEDN